MIFNTMEIFSPQKVLDIIQQALLSDFDTFYAFEFTLMHELFDNNYGNMHYITNNIR